MNSLANSFQYNYFIQSEKTYNLNTRNIKIGIKMNYKGNIHIRFLSLYIIGEDNLYMYEV